MKLFQYWLMSVTLFLVTASVGSAEESSEHGVMGTVLKFPRDNSYRIEPNEETKHFSAPPISLLYAGDKISILEDNEVLWFNLGGSKSIGVTKQNSPYIVEKLETTDIWKNFVKWLLGISGKANTPLPMSVNTKGSQSVDVTSDSEPKSESLTLNVLSSDPRASFLIAGERSLYLSWKGGQPPYIVRISKLSEDTWCEDVMLSTLSGDRQFRTEKLEFKPNAVYQVVIKDSSSTRSSEVIGQFRSFDEDVPYPQDELKKFNQEFQNTVQALWMEMKTDKNESRSPWRFETYQQLSVLSENETNLLSKTLKEHLEN